MQILFNELLVLCMLWLLPPPLWPVHRGAPGLSEGVESSPGRGDSTSRDVSRETVCLLLGPAEPRDDSPRENHKTPACSFALATPPPWSTLPWTTCCCSGDVHETNVAPRHTGYDNRTRGERLPPKSPAGKNRCWSILIRKRRHVAGRCPSMLSHSSCVVSLWRCVCVTLTLFVDAAKRFR